MFWQIWFLCQFKNWINRGATFSNHEQNPISRGHQLNKCCKPEDCFTALERIWQPRYCKLVQRVGWRWGGGQTGQQMVEWGHNTSGGEGKLDLRGIWRCMLNPNPHLGPEPLSQTNVDLTIIQQPKIPSWIQWAIPELLYCHTGI